MAIIFYEYKKSFVMCRGYQITGVSRRCFFASVDGRSETGPSPCNGRKMLDIAPLTALY